MLKNNANFDPWSPLAKASILASCCTVFAQNMFHRDQLAVAERCANYAARILKVALANDDFHRIGLNRRTNSYHNLVWRAVRSQASGMGLDPNTFARRGSFPDSALESKYYFDLGMYCSLGVFDAQLINHACQFINRGTSCMTKEHADRMRRAAVAEISSHADQIARGVFHPHFGKGQSQEQVENGRLGLMQSASQLYQCTTAIVSSPKISLPLAKALQAFYARNDRHSAA